MAGLASKYECTEVTIAHSRYGGEQTPLCHEKRPLDRLSKIHSPIE